MQNPQSQSKQLEQKVHQHQSTPDYLASRKVEFYRRVPEERPIKSVSSTLNRFRLESRRN